MKDVLDKVKDLHGMLEDKNNRLDALLKENKEVDGQLKARAAAIVSLEHELERREYDVKKIENAVKLQKDAEVRMAEAVALKKSAEDAKIAWASERALQERAIDDKRMALANEERNADANRKAVNDRIKKFEQEVSDRVGEIVKKMGLK